MTDDRRTTDNLDIEIEYSDGKREHVTRRGTPRRKIPDPREAPTDPGAPITLHRNIVECLRCPLCKSTIPQFRTGEHTSVAQCCGRRYEIIVSHYKVVRQT